MKTTTTKISQKLPEGILVSDFIMPRHYPRSNVMSYATTDVEGKKLVKRTKMQKYATTAQFDLWYTTAFGWVIPTLLISTSKKYADRTYAVDMAGRQVRVGKGPHVLAMATVYVKNNRIKALQKFFDLLNQGEVKSNEIRDRISSRRAQTIARHHLQFF